MPNRSLTTAQVLTVLAQTPLRIAALTADLLPSQLLATPHRDEWSVNDVLAHLRSCADVWGRCVEMIISQDTPTIRAVNPRTWINSTDYLEQEFRLSLHAFAVQRSMLLAVLEPLTHEGWSRAATVIGTGRPLFWTVYTYAQRLARHEQTHLKQIEHIVNTFSPLRGA